MISHLLLSFFASTTNIADLSVPPSTAQVRIACVKATEGDASAESDCISVIRKEADELLVDELSPEFTSSCLVIERISQSELIWKYLDWLAQHPDTDVKPASTTINAALLETLPCGWFEM